MSVLNTIVSLAAAASMMIGGALVEIAPQHNPNGMLFLVNRQEMVCEAYVPVELAEAHVPGSVRRMRPEAAAALEEMFAACKEETGATLISISGYRDYQKQTNIYRRKLRSVKQDVAKAQEYVAPPGASEHHTGLAMDIGQRDKKHLDAKFADTKGGIWCKENCWRFGFILRYGEEWEDITGYKYEPWHFRYVGKEKAKEITEANVPYETWMTGYRTEIIKGLLKEAEGE